MTDYIKKNGVIRQKEILFAPMLATFGGGSARGFNPGGGAGGGVDFTAVTKLKGAVGPQSTSDLTVTDVGDTTLTLTMDTTYDGYFHFTIPAGSYTITLDGAAGCDNPTGGSNTAYFGKPARMSGDYTFSSDTALVFLLGQPGFRASTVGDTQDSVGAGGTFLASDTSNGNISSAVPIAVAGGASMSYNQSAYDAQADANLATSGQDGVGGSNGQGGTNGGGGSVGCGYGAAGFYGNGNQERNGTPVVGGGSSCVGFDTSYTYVDNPYTNVKRNSGAFKNGGQGAIGYQEGTGYTNNTQGGFGCGAGSGNNGIGGGGGYSGGGSTYAGSDCGGGGGSFQATGFTNTSNSLLAINTLRYGRINIVSV